MQTSCYVSQQAERSYYNLTVVLVWKVLTESSSWFWFAFTMNLCQDHQINLYCPFTFGQKRPHGQTLRLHRAASYKAGTRHLHLGSDSAEGD